MLHQRMLQSLITPAELKSHILELQAFVYYADEVSRSYLSG